MPHVLTFKLNRVPDNIQYNTTFGLKHQCLLLQFHYLRCQCRWQHGVMFEEIYQPNFSLYQAESFTDARSRSRTERHHCVGFDVVFIFRRETFRIEFVRTRKMLQGILIMRIGVITNYRTMDQKVYIRVSLNCVYWNDHLHPLRNNEIVKWFQRISVGCVTNSFDER